MSLSRVVQLKFVRSNKILELSLLFLALLVAVVPTVRGAETDDSQTIAIFTGEETAVSTSPIPRPISKIAENVTVITADDIARLNAHTLAEVLQTVPGIQLDFNLRTPGTFTFFNVQGALNSTVLVLIDGIRQNDFDQDFASPGLIPVQQIERVEIIKGAASGSWGSALGGVVNIVTKAPNAERPVSGMVSGSIGSRFTADTNAELSGTKNRFGYYLTAGHLRSDGLTPNTATSVDNLYGKLSYSLPGNGTATFGLSHLAAKPGLDEANTERWGFVHDNSENRRTYGFLKLQQPLANKLSLDIQGYATGRDDRTKYGGRNDQGAIAYFNDYAVRDSTHGVNASLSLGDSQNNLITGTEYVHGHSSFQDLQSSDPPFYDRSWDSFAWYGNGSFTIGQLALLPGVRFDHTGFSGDETSYSLGLTYQLAENTTLRAYAARGFSLPMLVADTGIQKVKTVQGGIETGAVPYLWLKGTYFYNSLRNSASGGEVTVTNQTRQGVEIEARTTPLWGLSLAGGYTFLYARDLDTGVQLQTNSQQSVPPHIFKLALNGDHPASGLRGALTGNYVIWNGSPDSADRSAGMIWDLHLDWKLSPKSALSPELFFSAHNLFNGVQTTNTVLYNNANRWYEGGARLKF
jgi:vitamin B12 transporter